VGAHGAAHQKPPHEVDEIVTYSVGIRQQLLTKSSKLTYSATVRT
jgi:hypothetical protein